MLILFYISKRWVCYSGYSVYIEPVSKVIKEVNKSTPAGARRGVFFQAAIKFVQSHLNGTFRLIVSPGSPRR
jgi:hypothetical protein